ncbi:MAG: molybdopterin/thiamine biosynthesis adenylyltransferase, partial [Granulosicoccus sp.]
MISLSDDQLLRYARNILLPDVDVAGQARLLASHVAVIGVGGLGSPVIQY